MLLKPYVSASASADGWGNYDECGSSLFSQHLPNCMNNMLNKYQSKYVEQNQQDISAEKMHKDEHAEQTLKKKIYKYKIQFILIGS